MFFLLPSNFKLNFVVIILVVILSQKGMASMSYSDTATLAVKGKATILNCKLQLLKVLSDSRCPLNSKCVVAGAVTCLVRINGVKQTISSASGWSLNGEKDKQVRIEMKEVNPIPTAGIENNYCKYKVIFEVHKVDI